MTTHMSLSETQYVIGRPRFSPEQKAISLANRKERERKYRAEHKDKAVEAQKRFVSRVIGIV